MIGLLLILLPAVAAPIAAVSPVGTRATWILLGVAIVNMVATLVAVTLASAPTLYFLDGYFVLDATSTVFLLLINVLFLGIASYVWGRVRSHPELGAGMGRFSALSLAFVTASNLAVLANHMLVIWVCLELTTLVAVPLVRHGGGTRALAASWKYFLFSSVGLALALLGFACLARSMSLSSGHDVRFFLDQLTLVGQGPSDVWRRLGFVLIVVGYGTKLGLAPMYAWLPETYDAAPPPVTAMLATVQFNAGALALFRVLQITGPADRALVGSALTFLGLASMAVSSFSILATRDYKRLIAYASINHAGVIAVGLGVGPAAAYGVVLYVVSNAFIKAILFLTAGKVRSHYKTQDMRQVSGLIKDMPYSGLFFAIGIFALLGFPPFGSFLGELIIMSGLVKGHQTFVFVAFCAILTITFAATGRSVFPMIWGAPKGGDRPADQSFFPMLPKIAFLSLLIVIGLYVPPSLSSLLQQVAASLGPR
ncbi:MAG: hypothetical protein IT370_06105 [Deltaproteobacteria bacterium]|nr:hypothetical protein [Deltaproteobacteria bacterium]